MKDFLRKSYDFVTLYTHGHRPILVDDQAKQCFLDALAECRRQFQLEMAAYVLLNDHVHLLYAAPDDHNQSAILNHLRGTFARHWRQARNQRDDSQVWEKGVELRSLKDNKSIRSHLDYIHYDPVWHGLAQRAADYAWSSLPARVEQGIYASNWAEQSPPAAVIRLARQS